ncbi:MAG: class E sortase [Acidimicrobiales bacterium]
MPTRPPTAAAEASTHSGGDDGPDTEPRTRSGAERAVSATIGVVGELLITAGLVVLLFAAWQLWWTDVVANREQRDTVSELRDGWASTGPTEALVDPSTPIPAVPEPVPITGDVFAVLYVPRFGLEGRPVVEGTGDDDLQRGVGHYEGSAMPGEVGNLALAGHRVTYGRPFNRIAELEPGDPLVVETASGWYLYRVTTYEIVPPTRTEVVAPVPGDPAAVPTAQLITLTSCHPQYSARERYIVHGALESWQPAEAGPPDVFGDRPPPARAEEG